MLPIQKERTPHFSEKGGAGIAIVVIVVVLIAALAGYFFVLHGNHAKLEIEVQSTHILTDTEVTVYVDGREIERYAAGNLSSWKFTYDYSFSIFDDSKSIMVKATSTGGGLGDQSDQEAVSVKDGGTYSITLYV